jgi:hypothetical protein
MEALHIHNEDKEIEVHSDTEFSFSSDFVGGFDIKVCNTEKPILIILRKERTLFIPHLYWCFYNIKKNNRTCFCVDEKEDLVEGDVIHLEFDDKNCLLSINNEILSHIMD